MWRDRGLVKEMVDRAAGAGYEALMLTVDTAVLRQARARRAARLHAAAQDRACARSLDGAVHPGWTWQFVRSEPIKFANVTGLEVGDGTDAVTLADYINAQFDPSLSWTMSSGCDRSGAGPIVVKGIQTVEDAAIASQLGIDAIALSNHGGRQLDGAPATDRPRRAGARCRRRRARDHL